MNSFVVAESLQALLDAENAEELSRELSHWLPPELAELISHVPESQQLLIFQILPLEKAVRTFEFLPFQTQKNLLSLLPSSRVAGVLNALSPDDRTAFLAELPAETANQFIKFLSSEERALALTLLGYPEESVGRLMTPDYIAVKLDWTISQVLEYIRAKGRGSETINVIYVIDDQGVLLDDLSIREIILALPFAQIRQIVDHKFVALSVYSDVETAIRVFKANNRTALPVTDGKGVMVGIVTIDDILQAANRVDTEDIQKIGGMQALEEPYLTSPFFLLMRKRAGWLVILFFGEMLTSTALGYFEGEISKAVVLALFIPLILSSGGNSGSQAATLVTRSLALGEVRLKDWWRIFRLELTSGLFLGAVLGLIGLIRVAAGAAVSSIYGPYWMLVGITVGISILGVVCWATLVGALMPLALKRVGLDPATSSTPLIATLVDVTGLVIYFLVAMVVLKGTLL